MTRPVCLLVYSSHLFPAHWELWIPSIANPEVGKVIQVSGDALQGFEHEFKRNHCLMGTGRKHICLLLSLVEDNFIVDVPGNGSCSADKDAADAIERAALLIPAPRKSLASVANAGTKTRVEIKNCQTWVRELVVALVADGILSSSAITVLDNAPQN